MHKISALQMYHLSVNEPLMHIFLTWEDIFFKLERIKKHTLSAMTRLTGLYGSLAQLLNKNSSFHLIFKVPVSSV